MPRKEREASVEIPGKKTTLAEYEKSKKSSTTQNIKYPSATISRPPGTAHWEAMMKKFSQDNEEHCRKLPTDLIPTEREKKDFPTGSSYEGSWNALGMGGEGTYKFPNSEAIYVGEFHDGMFHGNGELRYETGAILRGQWHKGRLTEKTLIFDDGLEYADQEWQYCRYPDRRYTEEINYGLEPAGRSNITADFPTPEIPEGTFDVGDGFFDPETKFVCQYGSSDGTSNIIRTMGPAEQQWVEKNCRTKPDPKVGPCHFFYEKWEKPDLEAPVMPEPPAPTYRWQEANNRCDASSHVGMSLSPSITAASESVLFRNKEVCNVAAKANWKLKSNVLIPVNSTFQNCRLDNKDQFSSQHFEIDRQKPSKTSGPTSFKHF